ncbi:MAG: ATP-binding protein [Desulfosarcinaceae bacterium]|nr:ATP-binding protein [Desulfosarcinaceae bacterium]
MRNLLKKRVSLKHLLITALTIALVFIPLYFWLATKQRALIMAQVEKQAVILHRQIVLTRQWVADHSYVLISGKAAQASPKLVDPAPSDAIDGKAYTRITPAGLTRRLSEYAARNDLYAFNLTNFNALNPSNVPDPFEAEALEAFRSGQAEALSRVEHRGAQRLFRYAAPLIIGESCLTCHKGPQYRLGAIGGCISVLIPFDETYAAIREENLTLFYSMAGLTLGVILILYLATQIFVFRPIKDIRRFTARLGKTPLVSAADLSEGDELERVAGLCYLMDEKLKDQHRDLEARIATATEDLNNTNAQLADANRELAQLNQAKTEFFSEISHELRTPLTSIKGAIDFLKRRGGAAGDTPYLGIIQRNTQTLIRTISDFLDYSKIEAGRLELSCEAVELDSVAAEVVTNMGPNLERKQLRVQFAPTEIGPIPGDRHRIGQVYSNLLANAVKFSPAGGRIDITIAQAGAEVVTRIEDQGPGIPARHHEAIFRKFYQLPVDGEHTTLHAGSAGIGLAICKGVVAAHGGRIWVESEPGAGSCFCVALPVEGHAADCVEMLAGEPTETGAP